MSQSVDQLREIISRLRAPGGCPWDREQTASSLRPSLVEEAYEVVDAIEREDTSDIQEELGDLLINIMMQAEIASEQNSFTLDAIADTASEKLIRRHPHVFASQTAENSEAVLRQWEEIKMAERAERAERVATKGGGGAAPSSLLDGVARAFPALVRAQKIQKKAAKAKFDWERPEDVVEKIREELAEVEVELSDTLRQGARERLSEEVGDLLFAVVNLARALSIDSEVALQAATDKFMKRFAFMESIVPSEKSFSDLSLVEMNTLWGQAKQAGKKEEEK